MRIGSLRRFDWAFSPPEHGALMREDQLQTVPASDFLEAVRRSGVVDEQALQSELIVFDELVVQTGTDSAADDSAELAKYLIRRNLLTRYQAKELLQGRFRRLRMDHFVIQDLLGVGGMGSVFRARDEQRDEDVALKVLSERFKHDTGMRARFRLEARAGMRLDHPGIVKTYEVGVTDDVFGEVDYATMELFEGIALHELIGIMGPLPVNAACDIICQTAGALAYIHQQEMVHRDVKPDNILIDREGRVKVIDFGLTLINEAIEGEEFSLAMIFGHDCLGTPDYMPPEQAIDSHAADPRSDVYGLGCTLFVGLTAKRPFYGKSTSEVIRLHRKQPPPDPRTIIETTPPEIARTVLKMLAKNPDDRFQTMGEVRDALQPFAAQRRIDFSFSQLVRNRLVLAIKQGRFSLRRTSTAMRLSSAGRRTKNSRTGTDEGHGSAAALKATDAPRDTAVGRASPPASGRTSAGSAAVPGVSTSAASEAAGLLHGMGTATDEQAAASGAMLKLPDGGLFRLAKAEVVIGRSREQTDLWLDDKRLSGRHCRLTFDGKQWQVLDLESRNGIEVNGRRVTISPLFGRDQLTLSGEITLTMDWSRRHPRRRRKLIIWAMAAAALLAIAGAAALLW